MKQSYSVVAALLLLTGCASSSKLSSDLSAADAGCHHQNWPNKSALVQCLAAGERPVWAIDEPSTLSLYDAYAAQRAELARRLDQGAIDDSQYDDELSRLDKEFKQRITQQRQASTP